MKQKHLTSAFESDTFPRCAFCALIAQKAQRSNVPLNAVVRVTRMKSSEGVKILSLMTLVIGIWSLYGGSVLLLNLLEDPEIIVQYDHLYINGGILFYKILAYMQPALFVLLIIAAIGSYRGNSSFYMFLLIVSFVLVGIDFTAYVMQKYWLLNSFIGPHISSLVYVFNIVFFFRKLRTVHVDG